MSRAELSAANAPADATCAECGAPLAADQRYCLACGRPASPVRLAFLDVLQAEQSPGALGGQSALPPAAQVPAYYAPPPEPGGLLAALRRYSGLLALAGVLLASLLIGLLVGHWITGGNGGSVPARQVVEVKGLGPLAAVSGAAGGTTSSPSSSSAGGSSHAVQSAQHETKEEAKEEAQAAKEVKAAKAPPVVHKKTTSQSLQKLGKSTGKQHAKEVNELIKGDEPIETGH